MLVKLGKKLMKRHLGVMFFKTWKTLEKAKADQIMHQFTDDKLSDFPEYFENMETLERLEGVRDQAKTIQEKKHIKGLIHKLKDKV